MGGAPDTKNMYRGLDFGCVARVKGEAGREGLLGQMMLFSRGKGGPGIEPGDVFHKLGTYGSDWTVERIFDYADIPRHVRLIDRKSGRTMTVAADMLLDPDSFVRRPA